MKKTSVFASAAFIPFILSGCAGHPTVAEQTDAIAYGSQKAASTGASTTNFRELDNWLAANGMKITVGMNEMESYQLSHAQRYAIAYGEGFPAPDALSQAQKRQTAIRAAEVVAQRNMVRMLATAGTGIKSETGVVDRLNAFLKGGAIVASEYDPASERGAVLLRLELSEFPSGYRAPAHK